MTTEVSRFAKYFQSIITVQQLRGFTQQNTNKEITDIRLHPRPTIILNDSILP